MARAPRSRASVPKLIELILGRKSYLLVTASWGITALAETNPDLMLLDCAR